MTSGLEPLTCAIPLYRSMRFQSFICDNIDRHLRRGASIVIGDRHGLDDLPDILQERYGASDRVRILRHNDQGSWVANINALLQETRTPFVRILPHDDSSTAESSQLLLEALVAAPDAIVATGRVTATDLHGRRMPERDEPLQEARHPSTGLGSLESALPFFWTAVFPGAFKGVVRCAPLRRHSLWIHPTPTLVHSERTWLFALGVIGHFLFLPEAVLVKRYYPESTHQQWRTTSETLLDAAATMSHYIDRLVDDPDFAERARRDVYRNARRRMRGHPHSDDEAARGAAGE